MDATADRERARRRRDARLAALRKRVAAGSMLAFAALVGLASHHAVGSSKRRAVQPQSSQATASPTAFFDEAEQGFAFDDSGVATQSEAPAQAAQAAQASPPPVAETSVS